MMTFFETPRGRQVMRAVLVTFLTLASVLILYIGMPYVYPFLIAWGIAYILNPVICFFERKAHFRRWQAVLVTILLFLGVIVTGLIFLTNTVLVEAGSLMEMVQNGLIRWKDKLLDYYNSSEFQEYFSTVQSYYQNANISKNISSTTGQLANYGVSFVSYLFSLITGFLGSLPMIALITVFILLATFIISKDWYKLMDHLKKWVPEKAALSLKAIKKDLERSVFGYIKGHLILSSLTAVVFIIGLMIMKVEYAITIGIIGGIVDLIPMIGIPAILVPWSIYSFITGDLYHGVGLLVLLPIIMFTRHVLEPKVYASSIGLNPLMLLMFIFIGLKLFGVKGIIIGILALVIVTSLSRAGVFRDVFAYIRTGNFHHVQPPQVEQVPSREAKLD